MTDTRTTPTPNQLNFLTKLATELGWNQPTIDTLLTAARTATRQQVSKSIDAMIAARRDQDRQARINRTSGAPTAATGHGPARIVVQENRMYALQDGTLVRITRGQSGGLYGKKLVVNANGTGSFVYERGLKDLVERAGRPLTQEEAASFGAQHAFCCACLAPLSNPTSLQFGYGGTCAAHNGWTWFNIESKKGQAKLAELGIPLRNLTAAAS